MAELSITAANVHPDSLTNHSTRQVGETVTAGQSVYLKSSDNKWWLADAADSDETAGSVGLGVALTGSAADGYAVIAVAGTIDVGATLTAGTVYIVSDDGQTGFNAGGICPLTDYAAWGAGTRLSILGYASSTSKLVLNVTPVSESK